MTSEQERLNDEMWANAFDVCHFEAEEQHKALQCPLSDAVDPRLMGKYGSELATIAYRLGYRSDQWPTVAAVIETFGHDFRFTPKASAQILADELDRPNTMLFLTADSHLGSDDWHVMVLPERINLVHELYTHWELTETQLVNGARRAVAGDPDPFGTIEDLAYRQGRR